MVVDKDIKHLFEQLALDKSAEIQLGGSKISILMDGEFFSFKTPVYSGGNYIPKSVRECLNERAPFDRGNINTHLTIDEDNFQISLNSEEAVKDFTANSFIILLEEFTWLAQEWRFYLDEHDKNDLVHIPV